MGPLYASSISLLFTTLKPWKSPTENQIRPGSKDLHRSLLLLLGCPVLPDSVTLWTVAHQAPWSMEFLKQE